MRVCIRNRHHPMMESIPKHVCQCCDDMMVPHNFKFEMHIFTQLSFSSVFVIEILGIRLSESNH